eukprot:m.85043 g.85043  ORF g.85043 m.85043 type:complete len:212 (+) comp12771_c0_seq1:110-745(+)
MAANIGKARALRALADDTLEKDLLEDELEADDVPAHIREARMQQFREEMEALKLAKESGSGDLAEIEDEKKLFEITTSQPRVVCHFHHPDFRRCAIMNRHLRELARKHFTTKFVSLNVEQAPFLMTKLDVHVLPSVLCFMDGVVKDRLVGFEDLGNSDDFSTKMLESRMAKSGVITLEQTALAPRQTVFGFRKQGDRRRRDQDSSDDSDSD